MPRQLVKARVKKSRRRNFISMLVYYTIYCYNYVWLSRVKCQDDLATHSGISCTLSYLCFRDSLLGYLRFCLFLLLPEPGLRNNECVVTNWSIRNHKLQTPYEQKVFNITCSYGSCRPSHFIFPIRKLLKFAVACYCCFLDLELVKH